MRGMSTLRQILENQAYEFASAVIGAFRGASLEELMSLAGRGRSSRASVARPGALAVGRPGRLGRRSPEEIAKTLESIVSVLHKHPEGLRAEQIKAALQLDTREVPRPLAEGLRSGALKKTGQKRATTYFLGTGSVKVSAGAGKRERASGATKRRGAKKKAAKA